jgi:hypothetical protein
MVFETSGESHRFPVTAPGLINRIRATFRTLPDYRKGGNNQKYSIEDAALSAFSVFFTQSPSFLDYQVRMLKAHGKNNAQSIFGVHQISTTHQICNLLVPIPPTPYLLFWSALAMA